jgi:hypothetical protein
VEAVRLRRPGDGAGVTAAHLKERPRKRGGSLT